MNELFHKVANSKNSLVDLYILQLIPPQMNANTFLNISRSLQPLAAWLAELGLGSQC